MRISHVILASAFVLAAQPDFGQSLPGEVDLSFDAGSQINGPVNAAALLGDGRVLITGSFTTVNGETINGLARLQTNGATDLTFTNDLGLPTLYGRTMAVQPDGKIVVGGVLDWWGIFSLAGIVRFNADGSVDNLATFSGTSVSSVALQKDGKILVAGNFAGSGANYFTRLNTDATRDTTFLYGLAGADNAVNAIELQKDGNIVIAGSFTNVNGATRLGIARLLPDGSLDTSFLASVSGGINSVAIQSDGKLVIGGNFTSVNGAAINRIARLNADGSLDNTFSAGRSGADSIVNSVKLQPDGRIVLAGSFATINGASQRGVARLNTDGSRDVSFSVGAGPQFGSALSLTLYPGGEVLVAGTFSAYNGSLANNLVRLESNGALDPAFANGSTLLYPGVSWIVAQSDGKILVNGSGTKNIGRLTPDGSPDAGFLSGMSGANAAVYAIAPVASKILIGGYFTSFNGSDCRALARLNSDGSLDSSFQNGIGGTNGNVSCLAVQADGKVLVGGSFSAIRGTPRANIARLKPDGSLDTGFLAGISGQTVSVNSLLVQPDNKILVGGYFTNVNGALRRGVARLYPDGSLDQTYQTNTAGVNGSVLCMALQPDLKVLLGGQFSSINNTSRTHLARLNVDGTLDTSFDNGAVSGGASPHVRTIAVQNDGRVLVGGQFSQIGSVALNNIARLSATGAVETFMTTGADDLVYKLALLDDTRMLVGGAYSTINGAPRSYLSRVFYSTPALPSVPLDVALNNSQLSWTNDPVAPWQGQTVVSQDNVASARSGSITDRQSTTLRSSVAGPGLLSFWWKVSSETNFDFLIFTAKNPGEGITNQARISGETGWLRQIMALPEGMNTLEWTYSKDGSVSVGLDAGWVDEVSFTPGYVPPIILSDPVTRTNLGGDSLAFTASATGSTPLSYQWLLNGTPIPGATNSVYSAASVVPEQAGAYTLRVSSPYGTATSAEAQLVVLPLRAFGQNDYGQTNAISNRTVDAVAIAAGQDHSLLLRRDGTIYAWGNNGSGQCSPPADLGPALGIAGGGYHSLAVTANRTVVGWGDNSYGQISPPANLSDVSTVAAGFWHSLALRSDGTVVGWGDNSFGQAVPPLTLDHVVAIAAGGNHSLALRNDGVVFAWGQNTDPVGIYSGQSSVPWSLTHVVAIAAGEYHSLAVRNDGSIVAWGDDTYGQCNVPTNLPPAVVVAAGGTHSLTVLADGAAAGWGDNFFGQSGLLRTLTNVVAVAAGNAHTLELFGLRPAPRMQRPVWNAGQFSVLVPTFSDRLYSLEYTTSLPSTNWLPLPLVRGLGGVQILSDLNPAAPRRFYRARQW
ncbi:MAG TPA: hypothetical protein VJA21_04170 [Verrucomicrobiae bacterium]